MKNVIAGILVGLLLVSAPVFADDTPSGGSGGDTPSTTDILSKIYAQMQKNTSSVNTVNSTNSDNGKAVGDNWNKYFDLLNAAQFESATDDGLALLVDDSGYNDVQLLKDYKIDASSEADRTKLRFCAYSSSNPQIQAMCSAQPGEPSLAGYSAYSLLGPVSYDASEQGLADSYVIDAISQAINPVMSSTELVSGSPKIEASDYAAASLSGQALASIKASRTPVAEGQPSEMETLKEAVTAPIQDAWLKKIGVASNQQVLRSIAIMMAVNNYMEYRRLEQQQSIEAMLALQLSQQTRMKWLLAKAAFSQGTGGYH